MKYNEMQVLEKICLNMGVDLDEALQLTRKRPICEARYMFMYWLKEHTKYSLKFIGQMARRRPLDHTTVLHGIRTIKDLIATDVHLHDVWLSIRDFTAAPFSSMQYRP